MSKIKKDVTATIITVCIVLFSQYILYRIAVFLSCIPSVFYTPPTREDMQACFAENHPLISSTVYAAGMIVILLFTRQALLEDTDK